MCNASTRFALCAILFLSVNAWSARDVVAQSKADSLFQAARVAHTSGNDTLALRLYTETIRADSLLAGAYYFRARLSMDYYPPQAIVDFRRFTRLAPEMDSGWGMLSLTYVWNGQPVEAREASRKALALVPGDYKWLHTYGLSFLLESRADSAKVYHEETLIQANSSDEFEIIIGSIEVFATKQPDFSTESSELISWMQLQYDGWKKSQLVADDLLKKAREFEDRSEHAGASALYRAAAEQELKSARSRSSTVGVAMFKSVRAMVRAKDFEGAVRQFQVLRPRYSAEGPDRSLGMALSVYSDALTVLKQDSLALQNRLSAYGMFVELDVPKWREHEDKQIRRILKRVKSVPDYEMAVDFYRQLKEKIPQHMSLPTAEVLVQAGELMENKFLWDKALVNYHEAIDIYREVGNLEMVSEVSLSVAQVLHRKGDFAAAENILSEIGEGPSTGSIQVDILVSTAISMIRTGDFDGALSKIDEGLELSRKLNDVASEAWCLASLGSLYQKWGQYDLADENLQRALNLGQQVDDDFLKLEILNLLGVGASHQGAKAQAIDYLRKALQLARELRDSLTTALILQNIAYNLDNKEEAVELLSEALALATATGDPNVISVIENSISQYEDGEAAIVRLTSAIEQATTDENRIVALNNRSIKYYERGRVKEALADLVRATELAEQIRKAAPADVRREYLDKYIPLYRRLLHYTLNATDLPGFNVASSAFAVVNEMQARVMEEKFLESMQDTTGIVVPPTDPEQIFLIFENGFDDFPLARITADFESDSLRAYEFRGPNIDDEIREFHALLGRQKADSRGAASAARKNSPEEQDRLNTLSRRLYDILMVPIEADISGKRELVIITSGILSTIPFEALLRPDGSYLGEHFDIVYAPSFVVWMYNENRYYLDEEGRKPMLAFGGAIYDSTATDFELDLRSDEQQEAVNRAIRRSVARGGDQTESYSKLGYINWPDLPGTVAEVSAIADIIKNSDVIFGAGVTEERIKEMSSSGQLADYKVIHFATHGMFVPEVPELSALVLSQYQSSVEDGYLRMEEIAGLDIRADFVNLSACETGLGKIYGGEGIVGLTQAFMIAGANGLSVSLWQVSDESTSLFMQELYSLVAEDGFTYSAALAEVKRMFLTGEFGDEYRDPYYWAPFAFYGK